MKGELSLRQSLKRIRGVGHNLANSLAAVIERELKLSDETEVGSLSDPQIEEIEAIIKAPAAHGIPAFMLNRVRDEDDGTVKHVAQSDLEFAVRQDHESEKLNRSWIGWRTSLGQRVHGQHNRTTGRSGMTVGVLKKALKAQKEASSKGKSAAPAPAAKETKK
jgi:small subunit ribosomal protein S13